MEVLGPAKVGCSVVAYGKSRSGLCTPRCAWAVPNTGHAPMGLAPCTTVANPFEAPCLPWTTRAIPPLASTVAARLFRAAERLQVAVEKV